MNIHHMRCIAFFTLPIALACGSHQDASEASANGTSHPVSERAMPETPLALLEAYSPEDADALSERLFRAGFDIAGLRVDGDDLIVEGDIVFRARDLLEDFEPTIEKGYRVTPSMSGQSFPMVSRNRLKNIKLVLNLGAIITPWRSAAQEAAAAWSSTGIVKIAESNTGDTVTVSFANLGACSGSVCTLAVGDYPSGGKIGARVRINTATTTTVAEGKRVMLHELGHTLGFVHPTQGSRVGGTAQGTGYATVMKARVGDAASSLTSDDLLSLQRIYAPTSEAEYCNAMGLVICVATGQCVSPIEIGPLECNE
jgi:hypothetical protein